MEPICLLALLPWYLRYSSCMGRFHQHKTLDSGIDISMLSNSLQHHLLSSRLLHMVRCWHTSDSLGCIGQVGPLSDLQDSMMLGCEQCDKNDTSFSQFMFAYCVCNDKLPWFVGYTTFINFFLRKLNFAMYPNYPHNTCIDSNNSYQNTISKTIIQGHVTSISKFSEVLYYNWYICYKCQGPSLGVRGSLHNNFLATQNVFFLCNMYPKCNLAVPEVCNLGGFLLSDIYDGLLCNLGYLSKCVDGHDHGQLGSLAFANHVKFLGQVFCCIECSTRWRRYQIFPV